MRGKDIAMIFQDPLSTLNPVFSVGSQVRESLRIHGIVPPSGGWLARLWDRPRRAAEHERVLQVMRDVGIPSPPKRARQYPHQFSGGMQQRAIITRTQVSDAGLEHIARLASLRTLDISYTQVGDGGLAHLEGLDHLEGLSLHGTQVTDAGLAHLQGLSSLNNLVLQLPGLTDAGLEHLLGLVNLRKLDLRFTKVTGAGADRLKRALPDCKIYV